MKIGFFLMTQKGFDVLDALIENQQTPIIDFVCIGTDSNLVDDFSLRIRDLCESNSIKFFYRGSTFEKDLSSDYYIAISWRWLIDLKNLIVIHDSILPKYRGFAPLVNMLINGENEIGATALFASDEYDRGEIIAQEKMDIQYPIKIADAISKVGRLYILLVNKIITLGSNKAVEGVQQNEEMATYSLWLDKDDYFVDWNWSADKIKRKIDACGVPYDGAKTKLEDEILLIEEAKVEQEVNLENRVVGKVIFIKNSCPVVVCGEGLLRLTVLRKVSTKESILPLNKFRLRFG